MTTLRDQLEQIPRDSRERLSKNHFQPGRLVELARRLEPGNAVSNCVAGVVAPAAAEDIMELPERGTPRAAELTELGLQALRAGQVALVVLAGGMATRMGGVVKSLVDALPGKTFLDLRLAEAANLSALAGAPVPLWLMTSAATEDKTREALGEHLNGDRVQTFIQELSLRLTPQGDLFRDKDGELSEHAPGHGDLVDALRASGLLQRFVQRGGRYVTMTNIDNLGGGIDPLVIGAHISHGAAVSCEVVSKRGSDKGGIPLRLDGRPVVLEEFRLPPTFDPASVRVFNTNTFHFNAEQLLGLDMPWTFFTVEKKVDGKTAIQFERLVGEVTSYLDTKFLHCPRTGPESRFIPVKDFEELEQRREEIRLVAQDRRMIG